MPILTGARRRREASAVALFRALTVRSALGLGTLRLIQHLSTQRRERYENDFPRLATLPS